MHLQLNESIQDFMSRYFRGHFFKVVFNPIPLCGVITLVNPLADTAKEPRNGNIFTGGQDGDNLFPEWGEGSLDVAKSLCFVSPNRRGHFFENA